MLVPSAFPIADFLNDDFVRASRAGEMFVVRDTERDARVDRAVRRAVNIRAGLCVPFHHAGVWCFELAVCDTAPRVGSPGARVDRQPAGGAVFVVDRALRYRLAAGGSDAR